jgi:hypothetical protein
LVLAVAVGAVVGFVLLQPGDERERSATTPAQPSTGPARTAPARPAARPLPVITLRNGRPPGGVRELEFRRGQRVRFAVVSNVDDEVHVHGYDITRPLRAGRRVVLSFRARLEGVFEVESHEFETQVAELKVEP